MSELQKIIDDSEKLRLHIDYIAVSERTANPEIIALQRSTLALIERLAREMQK